MYKSKLEEMGVSDTVMSSGLQNWISELMKGNGRQSDPITISVSFTLQFEEFPLHPSSVLCPQRQDCLSCP